MNRLYSLWSYQPDVFMEMMLESVSRKKLTCEEAEFLQTSLRLVGKGFSLYQGEGYPKGHV